MTHPTEEQDPIAARANSNGQQTVIQGLESNYGLTKRQLFAAMAMQGMLAGKYCLERCAADCATDAVMYADCLLKELGK